MQPEHPQQIQPSELRVGDRITVPGRYGFTITVPCKTLARPKAKTAKQACT